MVESREFRDRYCAHYTVSEADFEVNALKRMLHWPWNWCVEGLLRVSPGLLETDREIIRQLGRVASMNNLAAELRGLRGDYLRRHDFGFSRRILKRRLSADRIFAVAKDCWKR